MRYSVSNVIKIVMWFEVLCMAGCSSVDIRKTSTSTHTPISAPTFPVTAFPTRLPLTGKIAFIGGEMPNYHLYVMNADGSALVDITPLNLLHIESISWSPSLSWSPDGQYIAFETTKDGVMQIFKIKPNGSGLVQLTFGKEGSFSPSWSPDGQYIAFAASKDNVLQIFKIKSDGSGLVQLTLSNSNGDEPMWSPDGKNIMFTFSNPDILDSTGIPGAPQIYIMNSDGTGIHRLAVKAKPENTIMTGSYQKDGLIAVQEPITFYAFSNYVVNPDGIIQKQFPEFSTESLIAWSPDGEFFAYAPSRRTPGCFGVIVMKFDQSEQKCLVDQQPNSSVYFSQVSWSPDGKYIMFSSNLNGDYDLYVIRPDGSGLIQLTNTPKGEDWAVWWAMSLTN
jgi:Tol biopolymer transport system component